MLITLEDFFFLYTQGRKTVGLYKYSGPMVALNRNNPAFTILSYMSSEVRELVHRKLDSLKLITRLF